MMSAETKMQSEFLPILWGKPKPGLFINEVRIHLEIFLEKNWWKMWSNFGAFPPFFFYSHCQSCLRKDNIEILKKYSLWLFFPSGLKWSSSGTFRAVACLGLLVSYIFWRCVLRFGWSEDYCTAIAADTAVTLQTCFGFSEYIQSKQQKGAWKKLRYLFSGFWVLNLSIFIFHCELALNAKLHRSIYCTIGLIHGLWTYRPNFVAGSQLRAQAVKFGCTLFYLLVLLLFYFLSMKALNQFWACQTL